MLEAVGTTGTTCRGQSRDRRLSACTSTSPHRFRDDVNVELSADPVTMFAAPQRQIRSAWSTPSRQPRCSAIATERGTQRVLGFGDLVLCAGTVRNTTFEEKVQIAATTGFAGVSVRPDEVQEAIQRAGSAAVIRRMLEDHGVEVADVDALRNWLGGDVDLTGARRDESPHWTAEAIIDLAAAVGSRAINIIDLSGLRWDHGYVVETFAQLCDLAAAAGIIVYIEFAKGTATKDLATAAAIITEAGRPNGGALLDTFHYHRGRSVIEDHISAHASVVKMVQMSDAQAEPDGPYLEETSHRRLLPGMGVIDLHHIVRELKAAGADAPIGVEVFSDGLDRVGLLTAARLAAISTQAILDAI